MYKIIKEVGVGNFIVAVLKEIYRKIYLEGYLGSYSQNKEDLIIEKYLPKTGRYLEIGAYHPTRLSNTFRFYKKGWSGVVVEPNPDVKKIFMKLRPRDTFVNMGVGRVDGQLEYFKYLIPALNTFSKEQVESDKIHKVYKVEKIGVIGIKKLLAEYINDKIDFLSLDVEGWDKTILDNWDWKYKPKVICIEDGNLKIEGYRLVDKTKDNSIYVLVD